MLTVKMISKMTIFTAQDKEKNFSDLSEKIEKMWQNKVYVVVVVIINFRQFFYCCFFFNLSCREIVFGWKIKLQYIKSKFSF